MIRGTKRRSALAFSVLAVVAVAALVVLDGADRRPAASRSGSRLRHSTRRALDNDALTIATFNIHGGRDASGRASLERISETMRSLDFVALQEVRVAEDGRDQAELLGIAHAMGSAFLPSERRWWSEGIGNAVASRFVLRRWESVPLANTSGKAYRNLVVCEMPWRGGVLTILSTHLARDADRAPQLREVIGAFLATGEPAVLAGDLNTRREDPDLAALLAEPGVVEPFRVLGEPDDAERIDWIIARGLRAVRVGKRDLGASDHPLVWAELALDARE